MPSKSAECQKYSLHPPPLYSVVMQYPPDDHGHFTLSVQNHYLTGGLLEEGIQCGQAIVGTLDLENQKLWKCEAQNPQVGPHDR